MKKKEKRKKKSYIQKKDYFSELTINELANHANTWKKPKCILLNEGNQSEKDTSYTTQII